MVSRKSALERQRELVERIQTEGAEAAFAAGLEICRDPTAPKQARATIVATFLRAGGYFDRKGEASIKEPHEMTDGEIKEAIARLSEQAAGGTARRDDDDSIFD